MGKHQITEPELADYFNEHIFYEVLMLRLTKDRLEREQEALVWNAMFAAFVVSARNLYYFVGSRDGDNMNVADYRHHCPKFRRRPIDNVRATLDLLHEQCLHLGKGRAQHPDKKINLDRIRIAFDWIRSNVRELALP